MLKVSSWNTLRGLTVPLALVVALLVVGTAQPAAAQLVCYQSSGNIGVDICGTITDGQTYDTKSANGGYFASTPDAPGNYLIACSLNDLTIYGLASPLSPTEVASTHIPWDWSNINTGGDTHGIYRSHLRDVATLAGFRYAVVSLGDFGWDFLQISGSGRGFVGAGFHPANQLASPEYTSAALFSDGVFTYAVAQKLDQTSILGDDSSIRIYKIGGATDLTPGLTSANMGQGVRVPTDASFLTPMNLMKLWVVNFNGKRLLFALRRAAPAGALIADITDPANPAIQTMIANDPILFGGRWAVDADHAAVWVADALHPIVHQFKIVQVLGVPGLSYQGPVTWWGTGSETVRGAAVSVAGNLLVAGLGYDVGYISLAGGTPTRLQAASGFTDIVPRTCLNAAFSDSLSDLCAFKVGTQHYAYRSKMFSTDIVAVSNSCISTIPYPDFTVTGGSASATCAGPVDYTQADAAFPGDALTIKDASGGVWTSAALDIQKPLGSTIGAMGGQTFPLTITNYGQTVPWTPPTATAPGDYHVVLSITGGTPPSTTKVISLCGNPQAALTVSVAGAACPNPAAGCGGLVNDPVVLGNAGTAGHPSSAPTFLYKSPAGIVYGASSLNLDKGSGSYTVGVAVAYDFLAADDPRCADPIFSTLNLASNGHYDSCMVGTISAGYGVASFQVEQPSGTIVATALQPGTVQVSQPVTLRFTGRVASGYNPNFTWTIPPLTGQPSCSFLLWPSVPPMCTIGANSMPVGPAQAWNLRMDVCSQGGLGQPCTGAGDLQSSSTATPVTVTTTQNSVALSANPTSVNIGTPITITLGQMNPPTSGYSSLLIDYGGMSCDGVSQYSVTCNSIFGQYVCTQGTPIKTFSYDASSAGTTRQITITGYLSTGGSVQSAPLPITIGTTGACPCPTVSPSISGPSSAGIGQSVSFSAQASAGGHAITNWSWTFGDGGTATGASVSHSWASAGIYTVQVTATSDCGSIGSATSTINIGSGGGGNLTITPSPNPADPGATVTFAFSPGIIQAGDSVTFNFGDGSQQKLSFVPGLCGPANPCSAIGHVYAQAGTFPVTASGTAGGASVNGSASVTVRNNCTLPSKPTAAFNWQPTQGIVGQPVRFQDTSTGGPTSWSWDFGGPGVAGTSGAQAAAVAVAATLTITPNNPTPSTGQQVTFTFSPAVTVAGDSVTFDFGDGTSPSSVVYKFFCSPATPCGSIPHTYTAAGTFTVTASGTAGGTSVSGTAQVVVSQGTGGGGNLTITANPASPAAGQQVTFSFSPTLTQSGDTVTFNYGDQTAAQAVSYPCQVVCAGTHTFGTAGTYSVSATGTAGGAAVSGSMTLVVSAGGGGGSTAQNPTFTYSAAGTYSVTLTASNCQGASQVAQQIVVLASCTQTTAPVADFTWGPTGALSGFSEQQQPYVGQQVTLTDRSTNQPDQWHWYDFQEDKVDATVSAPTFTHTWKQSGDKNVRMTARNCSGQWSSEVLKAVHIFEDVRHVTADFSWSPSDVSTGAQVTFTAAQGPAVGDPTDFAWTFDDGSTQSGASVTYSFKCGGTRRVTLTAARGSTTGTVTKSVTVVGTSCGPESVMGVDAAKIQGLNDTNWHADVRIYNPSAFPTSIWLEFLPVGTNNVDPFKVGPYQQPPKGTLVLDDILQSVYDNWQKNFSKTALRVTYKTDDNVAPVVTIRTYNLRPGGSKYGQINAGVNVVPGSTLSPQWITGLRNNGLDTGFRTNYSIVNLHGDSAGVKDIKFTLFDETGAPQGTKTFGLAPFGYIQDSIKNLFGAGFENIGTFSLKVEIPTGEDVQTYASVMDNLTGDPVMIPATTPPDSPIYVPAIAHLSGEANTVWRSDLQVTNPDGNGPHTWEIRYTPKGTGFPVNARSITLAPEKSVFIDDLVSWAYDGSASPLPADAQTSGIVRIAPVDGTNVYPVVAARSYNLTAVGTFGQGIPPLSAVKGVSAPDPTRLVLTGMSSEDISRTNLGFVNLSETQGVNFVVYFYDEGGRVLNPPGIDGQPKPYTFAIGPGTWDQDKLENRFRNAFKVALPANLRAVTAEIRVTDGGPGFAYASVIDNKTGDPNFIPAQLTP